MSKPINEYIDMLSRQIDSLRSQKVVDWELVHQLDAQRALAQELIFKEAAVSTLVSPITLKSGEQLLKMRTDQINGMVPIILRRVPWTELLDQFPEK